MTILFLYYVINHTMNSITELRKFTRSDLQGLKAEMERAQLKQDIDSTVHSV